MKEFYGVYYRRANDTEGTIYFSTMESADKFADKLRDLNYEIIVIETLDFGYPVNGDGNE